MKYYWLADDPTIPGRWSIGNVVDETGASPDFTSGSEVRPAGRLAAEVEDSGEALDFSLTIFFVPIASNSLAQAIAPFAGADLQHIPVSIQGHSGYSVLNSKRMVDCLGERSGSMKIDPSRVPHDAHFFRIARWPIVLIVSEPVRNALRMAGGRGAKFWQV